MINYFLIVEIYIIIIENIFYIEREKTFAYNLIEKSILVQPEICNKCGGKKINLVKNSRSKTTNLCFRYCKYTCKNEIPLRQNSFLQKFSHISISECLEVIKCFISNKFNSIKAK